MEASVVSDDVGRVDFNSSLLSPEKRRAVNCITVECVKWSKVIVDELLSNREHNSKISKAGVEKVFISVLLYNDVCMLGSP